MTKKANKLLTGISENVLKGTLDDNQKDVIEYAITAILLVLIMFCLMIMYLAG